ncbi:winged helix-turn-helix domain-containing protein, partial [Anaerostipes caccae]|uniref:winged helix-turn-helix domain-containing protein n=1 Tax=Anaerostipes caccae TaxID=105841 RepID=UPI00210B0E06
MTHKGLLINLSNSTACQGKEQIELSKNEVKILSVLVKHKEKIVSRDNLMEELWQSNEFVDDNTLTVNINRLRKKLDSIGLADYLVTKRGQGYLV